MLTKDSVGSRSGPCGNPLKRATDRNKTNACEADFEFLIGMYTQDCEEH